MQEAVDWGKRCPLFEDTEVEIRPIFCYSQDDVNEIEFGDAG